MYFSQLLRVDKMEETKPTRDTLAVFGCVSRSIIEGLVCQLFLAFVLGIGSFYIFFILFVILLVIMVLVFRVFFD